MKVPVWVHETAAFFWDAVGVREPFPRLLCEAIHRSPFELTIKELPRLTTIAVERYLAKLGRGWACDGPVRAVRACLAARDGAGFILLDAADPPARARLLVGPRTGPLPLALLAAAGVGEEASGARRGRGFRRQAQGDACRTSSRLAVLHPAGPTRSLDGAGTAA